MASTKREIPGRRQSCLIALSQVLDTLSPFADEFVLIGGWAPYFLLQAHSDADVRHIGSADLDFVFNSARMTVLKRTQIEAALLRIGCQPRHIDDMPSLDIPNSYWLPVKHQGQLLRVQIDLLGLSEGRNELRSQAELALREAETIMVMVGKRKLNVRVGGAVAIFAMKAIALNSRQAPKDAYDLYMLARYYKGGPEALAQELKPLLVGPPVRSAMGFVRRWFGDTQAAGPQAVVDFLLATGTRAALARLRALVYETVQVVLDGVGE